MAMADPGVSSEEEFFETFEEIASTSGSDSDGERLAHRFKPRHWSRPPDPGTFPFSDSQLAIWRSDPVSVGERRLRLFQKLGLDELLSSPRRPPVSSCLSFPPAAAVSPRVFRSISDPGENHHRGGISSPESPKGSGSSILIDARIADEEQSSSSGSSRDFVCRIKDLDSGKEFVVHELGSDGLWNKLREVGTGRELSLEEFESSVGIVQEMKRAEERAKGPPNYGKGQKGGWLRGLRGVIRKGGVGGGGGVNKLDNPLSEKNPTPASATTRSLAENLVGRSPPWKMQRMKVRVCKKAAGELAELYMGQEIGGHHQGPIWALRFSSGGRFLASGGQDCVVRVWRVVLLGNQITTPGRAPLHDRKHHKKSSRKLEEEKLKFRLPTFGLESGPACSLRGHSEDILDLSWSSSRLLLLSSSMDKTVRLWDVARRECLQVFSHNDYVTCIKFNPADDSCFLSGSLDGKVRIWSILDHHVVDWTDLREIVTAAAYTPDGTGAMIGSSKGTCRFYNTSGNKLQLDGVIEVVSKKGKSFRGRKISGIQCMPANPSKILVTSNDSQVRLYDGTDLIAKFKGFKNMSSQISASFSGNGNHIISASEDSHVYLWNASPPSSTCRGQLKMSERSCESFFSDNVTAAVPWWVNDGDEAKRRGDDRGAALNKLGSDLLQLLRNSSSFPGPCFECLTSTVFPVTDEAAGGNCGPVTSSSSSSSSGSSSSVELDSDPSTNASASKSSAAAVEEAAAGDAGNGDCFTDEPLELPAGGLGLVIVTGSLSGEIRTFQNYMVKETS